MPRITDSAIRFSCQQCGACCKFTGGNHYVYLTETDIRRMSRFLGLEKSAFLVQYVHTTDGLRHLDPSLVQCVFLGTDGCRVYPVRPMQCRAWPFWPENMEQSRLKPALSRRCPGIGAGGAYSARRLAAALRKAEQLIA